MLHEAKRSAEVTHDHAEGIRGAQATAAAMFLARTGGTKEQIRQYVAERFDYFLDETLNDLRSTYQFDASCQWSVPQSIIAFLESTGYKDAVRNAISQRHLPRWGRGYDGMHCGCNRGGVLWRGAGRDCRTRPGATG